MKISYDSKTLRVYFSSFVLLTLTVIAGIGVFRTSASDETNENPTKDGLVSVQLKSQNTTAMNFCIGYTARRAKMN